MKKTALITLALLVLTAGPAVYFLSSPERQVTETFSSFGFKNDATPRPETGAEEDVYGDDLGDPEEVVEYEDEWYGGGSDGDEPSSSSSGGSSTDGGGNAPSTGGTPGNTTDPSLAYTPSQTTPNTGSQGSDTTDTSTTATTPSVPPTYTLTVTSPTTGSTLNNAGPADIAKVFWTYGDLTAKITIELWNKSGLVRTLTTKTANSGRYAWAHAPTLSDGDYKLRLTAYSSTGVLRTTAETGYFEVSRVKEEVIKEGSAVSFTAAPITRNAYGVPMVTDSFDLNANAEHRLILATGGTRSLAVQFPVTKAGGFMFTAGINEYKRPDKVQINISTKPHDFTSMTEECSDYNDNGSDANINWVTTSADKTKFWWACLLEPGKMYYLNVRFTDSTGTKTACTEELCGIYTDVPPLGTISSSVSSVASCTTSADAVTDATKQGGGQYFFSLTGTKTMAVKFKPEYDYGSGNVKYFGQVAAITTPGNNVSKMIQLVVSECPGDFTKTASTKGICSRYGVEGGGNVSFGTQTSSNQGLNLCGPLDRAKTYYANVRYVDPSTGKTTCDPAYGQCNTVVGITYGNP